MLSFAGAELVWCLIHYRFFNSYFIMLQSKVLQLEVILLVYTWEMSSDCKSSVYAFLFANREFDSQTLSDLGLYSKAF